MSINSGNVVVKTFVDFLSGLDKRVKMHVGFDFQISRHIVSVALSILATVLTRYAGLFLTQKITHKLPNGLFCSSKSFFVVFMLYRGLFALTHNSRQNITDPNTSCSSGSNIKMFFNFNSSNTHTISQNKSPIETFKQVFSEGNFDFLETWDYENVIDAQDLLSAAQEVATSQNKSVAEILNTPQKQTTSKDAKVSLFWAALKCGLKHKIVIMKLFLTEKVDINQNIFILVLNDTQHICMIVQLIRLNLLNEASLEFIKGKWEGSGSQAQRQKDIESLKNSVLEKNLSGKTLKSSLFCLNLTDCSLQDFLITLNKVFNDKGEWIYPITNESR